MASSHDEMVADNRSGNLIINQSISEQYDQDSERPDKHKLSDEQDTHPNLEISDSEIEKISSLPLPCFIDRKMSEIPEDSDLYNVLDTGRLKKKFKDIVKIGQGGFGEVFKAKYHVDQKQYAIKKVRLHITKDLQVNALEEIYKHRVYREL